MKWELTIGLYVGLMALLLAAATQHFNTEIVFWLLYIAIVSVLSIIVLKSGKYRLLSIVLFDVFLFLLYTLQYPAAYQVDRDTVFETQYAEILADTGVWDATAGTGYAENYYGHNPAVHFVLAVVSLSTGISTPWLAKIHLMILFRIAFLLLAFRIMQILAKNDNIAYASLLVYLISPRLRILYMSRRLMAALMILFAIYCLLQYREKRHRAFTVLFAVFSLLVIVSDHTLALVYGIFLFGLAAFYWLLLPMGKAVYGEAAKFSMYFLAYAIFWTIWSMNGVTVMSDMAYLQGILNLVVGATSATPSHYTALQLSLMYISQIILVFVSIGYAAMLFLKKKLLKDRFLAYFTLFSLPLFGASLYLMSTEWVVLSNVLIWFCLIPVSYLTGLFVCRLKRVTLAMAALMLIFCGGILLNYQPHVLFKTANPMLVELPEYKNDRIIESAEFLKSYANEGAAVVADRSLYDIYSGYYGFTVTPQDVARLVLQSDAEELEKRFLTRPVYFGAYKHTSEYLIPEFIAVNRDLLRNASYNIRVSQESLEKFEKTKMLKKIFDNGKIVIYENVGGKLAGFTNLY
ncbi:MAG: hypothetical protein ABIF10_02490 [Candidatus Woesearchaeota archaeon]